MATTKHSSPGARRLGSFMRNQRGSISVLTAASMLPLIIAAGTAIDMNRANRTLSLMQKAADSAALAAAGTYRPVEVGGDSLTGDEARLYVADMMVEANLPEPIKTVAEDPAVTIDGNTIVVELAAKMATSFMSIVGIDTMDLSVTAAAEYEMGATGCVVALGSDGKGIKVGGTVDLQVEGCWLYSNKEGDKSIDVIGTAIVDVPGSCSVGTTVVSDNATVHEKKLSGCYPVADPMAGWTHPTVPAGCDYNNFKQNAAANKSMTLYPGVYCGGLQLSGYDYVDLQPGIYYIDGGPLTINSKVELTGDGVGFYLTNDVTAVTINGNANVSLSAPDSGTMDGLLFAMEPGAESLIAAKINGGSGLNLEGTIYLADGELEISGDSATMSAGMQIIADSINLSGTSKLSFTAQTDEFGNPLNDEFLTIVRLIK